MVAPTRKPQARGVKCDLCKKILNDATWLDQTKLAKKVKEAWAVLDLIKQHDSTDCPCIPKSIQNLLVGSTHFEIHRLVAKELDSFVHEKQHKLITSELQKQPKIQSKQSNESIINDCNETFKNKSRFKIYAGHNDTELREKSNSLIKHLTKAIDFWKTALEDEANPFNSKLALRLGLTHHVIYASYLFKYYKLVDYQLISANLLLNLFKSIEGVTTNALLHASYILIKSLIDCNQFTIARHYLKQASKIPNYQDNTHYESILLKCAECELKLLDSDSNNYEILDELARLAIIRNDDKLQHYYARTLSSALLIRYMSAIIRRCYENSFELVLMDKDSTRQQETTPKRQSDPQKNQILDHSWIRYAICDFVFNSFELLSKFFINSGQPEQLELLYNGLSLISFRNGSCYWQFKILAIGIDLDLLCDKYLEANKKLEAISHIIGHENNSYLMNLMRLELEIIKLTIPIDNKLEGEITVIKTEVVLDLVQRIKICHNSLSEKLSHIDLYDCKNTTFLSTKLQNNSVSDAHLVIIAGDSGKLTLKLLKVAISTMLKCDLMSEAQRFMTRLADQLSSYSYIILEYYNCQVLSEMLLCFANIEESEQILIDSIRHSNLFLEEYDPLSQFSSLTLNSDTQSITSEKTSRTPTKKSTRVKPTKSSQLSYRHKRKYDVASISGENLHDDQSVRLFDIIETIRNFSSLKREEIVVSYLRNCEPNPNYLLYRKAHELMLSFRLEHEIQIHQDDFLLYHFCESAASNTMRYRWMMMEEQQISPFEQTANQSGRLNSTVIKHLGFSNVLVNHDKTLKSFKKSIPNDTKMLQFKYVLEKKEKKEHLLIACLDKDSESFFVHVERDITSGDFLKDSKLDSMLESFTLPGRFRTELEDAKKSLAIKNYRNRSETRQNIEKRLSTILYDIEKGWLGSFVIMMCGKILDPNYEKFVNHMLDEFQLIMKDHICSSVMALRIVIENAPLLGRCGFLELLASLYNCSEVEVRECFSKWLKSFECHKKQHTTNDVAGDYYLSSLVRGQVGIILDQTLESIPLESLPLVRKWKQGMFRAPSLRLYNLILARRGNAQQRLNSDLAFKLDSNETFYMLDPANNLPNTRARFEQNLISKQNWLGTISKAPQSEQLEFWLKEKEIYLFIGHGAGTVYYNKLCKSKGLNSLAMIKPASIIMGCSSGRVLAEGPRLESFGIGWAFILKGSPAYVGLLWDVTDTDIDKFLDSLLTNWMREAWSTRDEKCSQNETASIMRITDAIAQSRNICQHEFLVGSAPIVYGLPVSC